MATVILYLYNVASGGDLPFPDSEVNSKMGFDCAKTSNVLRSVKGNAILFFTLHLNASPDAHSIHTRCPVLKGGMWSAVCGECTVEDANCPDWASIGECQRNPVYMIGSPDYYMTCRASCHVC